MDVFVRKLQKIIETLLVKLFSLETKDKIKHFQLLLKKSSFYFPRKQSMVPLDKEFQWINVKHRNSGPEVFCKKGALKSFTKFTEKPLCQGVFFDKAPSRSLQAY